MFGVVVFLFGVFGLFCLFCCLLFVLLVGVGFFFFVVCVRGVVVCFCSLVVFCWWLCGLLCCWFRCFGLVFVLFVLPRRGLVTAILGYVFAVSEQFLCLTIQKFAVERGIPANLECWFEQHLDAPTSIIGI